MTRDEFLAAIRELAEQLGAELWAIVERQTERARAAALEVAVDQLRGEIAGDAVVEPEPRQRAPRRCSNCRERGHDARRCDRVAPAAAGEAEHDQEEEGRPTAPPPGRADRFSAIEAAARARRGEA